MPPSPTNEAPFPFSPELVYVPVVASDWAEELKMELSSNII